MKEKIEVITRMAEEIYNLTKDKYTISKGYQELIQEIVDELQDTLDEIANELKNCPF